MKMLLFILSIVYPIQVEACLICIIKSDGQIIVGNHEDWHTRDSQVTFTRAENDQYYDMMYFGFESEGWAQGGLNEAGLFFDGTATPYSPLDQSDKRAFDGNIYHEILRNCRSVNEVMEYISEFQIPDIEQVHLFFADANGDWMIVGSYSGQLTFHYSRSNFEVLTNFNITDPSYGGEPTCMRHTLATTILEEEQGLSMETVKNVLENTTQGELTVYSNIYDLKQLKVYTYFQRDFKNPIVFDFKTEMDKGSHSLLLSKAYEQIKDQTK